MPGFDRSKLKATAATVIQKQEKDFKRGGGGLDFLSIETGENPIRVFPYHPDGGGESFAEAKSVSFLEVQVPKRDADKKVIEGEFEFKRKPIFNMKVHGNEEQKALKLDLVEAYMKYAKEVAIPNLVGDDKQKFDKIWNKIVGNALTKEQGIKPQDSWVMYAMKGEGKTAEGEWMWGKIGPIDIKKSVKDLMTEKAAELELPDPWTDPDEGYIPIITKAKTADKPSDWYKLRVDSKKDGKTTTYVTHQLSDEQINEWSEMKPLHELYVNSYKRKDFNYQVEGLKRFDDKLAADGYPILVFQYEEFLDIIEQVSNVVPEDNSQSEEEQNNTAKEVEKPEPVKKVIPAVVAPKVTVVTNKTISPPIKSQASTNKAVVSAPKPEAEVEVVVIDDQPAHISNVNDRLLAIRNRINKK
jgi:hypothetical protein